MLRIKGGRGTVDKKEEKRREGMLKYRERKKKREKERGKAKLASTTLTSASSLELVLNAGIG